MATESPLRTRISVMSASPAFTFVPTPTVNSVTMPGMGATACRNDPRIGRGWFPTWKADGVLRRWPLDHVLVSGDFVLIEYRVLPAFGSDHLPLLSTMCYAPRLAADNAPTPLSPLARTIGRSRFVVMIAVAAVMMVALSLFLLGAILAALSVWDAWKGVFEGRIGSTDLTVEFLEVVSVMLKAVVFYIIGVGLYSLFMAPLNPTVALGVETLNDLESKVISVVIVILAVTFLEHFIRWERPVEMRQ